LFSKLFAKLFPIPSFFLQANPNISLAVLSDFKALQVHQVRIRFLQIFRPSGSLGSTSPSVFRLSGETGIAPSRRPESRAFRADWRNGRES